MKPSKRRVLWGLGALALLGAGAATLDAWRMGARAQGRLYDELSEMPRRKVALVLGCVPRLPDGRNNRYFEFRMQAAARLFHAGKVDYLLVSGDNHRQGYDEPTAMREALRALLVPAKRIVLDYAGFRTLDSVVRAKEVFGLEQFTIVSQRFHNERAVYLAQSFGLDVVAYNAHSVEHVAGDTNWVREPLARLRAVLDTRVLGTRPKYTGPRVVIGDG